MKAKRRLLYNPPAIFLESLFVAPILHFSWPTPVLVPRPWNWLGLVPIVAGIALNLWADVEFKRRSISDIFPDSKPGALIETGPFALVRHPMYFGMLITLVGVAVWWGSLVAFSGSVLFWIAARVLFIPREEANMDVEFSGAWQERARRVRSWM